ncbi:hypothetical protein KI387_043702 [Taxus chinensis]|uniref:Retrovirus-related Pol polyprotein from transposon TNT 1-94-like beta-barrel domain-containing protein n=1 Tax=Taxus chinensis TaxID=29808 RepID=A0AA38LQ68_TAXCH|nr:hypothetical protein KI387_043702 [Taxus chinensis]
MKKKKHDSDSEFEKEDRDAFIATLATHAGDNAWLIDSDASFHMTPNKNWFSKYENYDDGKVYLGDNSFLEIVGHGSIQVKFSDGRIRRFDGVLHIPGLAKKLLSISKLIYAGVHVQFSEASVKMMRGVMVIARGIRLGTLYKLDACTVECNSTSNKTKPVTISLKKERVSSSVDGHGFWVPKGDLSTE